MREMKDSGVRWIGKIPTKWTIAKAKNCVEIQNGSDPKTEGSIPVYGSGSMSFKTCGEYKEGPSVLIGRKGATLHIPHYISSKFWNVDTAFNVYSKSIFDLKYYFYCAHVFDYTLYMSQTTLPSMTQTAYENMFLPLPTKEEQYAIANQLDQICSKIDAVLEKTRASIEEYKKLKQAVITQAVTKGIRGDRPMKDSGIEWIGDIPAEWDYTKAKNCVNIQNGSDPKTEGSIPVYGSGASSFKTCGEYKEGPSVLIGRKGATLHIPHYISTKFWNVDTAFNVYAKPNFDLKFYFYCACSFDYRFYISQTTLPSMTQTAYENMFLPLPSNDEQRAIASYLDNRCEEIDALIWKKQECLVEIENYKKSLIYEYVTGKREV